MRAIVLDRLRRKTSVLIHKMLINSVDWALYFEPRETAKKKYILRGLRGSIFNVVADSVKSGFKTYWDRQFLVLFVTICNIMFSKLIGEFSKKMAIVKMLRHRRNFRSIPEHVGSSVFVLCRMEPFCNTVKGNQFSGKKMRRLRYG
jgi:hypothetical protein